MTGRRDLVVVLARGRSRRMGRPKGLLPCPEARDGSFLACIVRAYRNLGLSGLVVTTPTLADAYAAELPQTAGFRVVTCPPGGDTGRTLWRAWSQTGRRPTHLWAHPVDLPLVQAATLRRLGRWSRNCPSDLVRPVWRGRPGHPVIIPAAVLAAPIAAALWRHAPMREVLAAARKLGHIEHSRQVPVADRGVVQDFDFPADLDRA